MKFHHLVVEFHGISLSKYCDPPVLKTASRAVSREIAVKMVVPARASALQQCPWQLPQLDMAMNELRQGMYGDNGTERSTEKNL